MSSIPVWFLLQKKLQLLEIIIVSRFRNFARESYHSHFPQENVVMVMIMLNILELLELHSICSHENVSGMRCQWLSFSGSVVIYIKTHCFVSKLNAMRVIWVKQQSRLYSCVLIWEKTSSPPYIAGYPDTFANTQERLIWSRMEAFKQHVLLTYDVCLM